MHTLLQGEISGVGGGGGGWCINNYVVLLKLSAIKYAFQDSPRKAECLCCMHLYYCQFTEYYGSR